MSIKGNILCLMYDARWLLLIHIIYINSHNTQQIYIYYTFIFGVLRLFLKLLIDIGFNNKSGLKPSTFICRLIQDLKLFVKGEWDLIFHLMFHTLYLRDSCTFKPLAFIFPTTNWVLKYTGIEKGFQQSTFA